MKPTPGSWKALTRTPKGKQYTYPGHYEIQSADHITIAATKLKGVAQLIETTPDLLEALIDVTDNLQEAHQYEIDNEHHGDESCSYCESLEKARAAIAKAKR